MDSQSERGFFTTELHPNKQIKKHKKTKIFMDVFNFYNPETQCTKLFFKYLIK